MTLARVLDALARGGLDLTGRLGIADYDSLVPAAWRSSVLLPGASGALIVGNAGRSLWQKFSAAPERALGEDPLDAYTRRILDEAARLTTPCAAVGFYAEQRGGQYLPLVKLAQRAGFGTPGRVGVLIHPVYGPWLAIRAVLLVSDALSSAEPARFDPCAGCPAPCASACHGGVIGVQGVDVAGCYQTRLTNPKCALACDARSACVVGPEHAYSAEQIAHHSKIRSH